MQVVLALFDVGQSAAVIILIAELVYLVHNVSSAPTLRLQA